MKIVHVIDDLGLGGAQRQLVELLKGLQAMGHETEVIALSEKKASYVQAVQQMGVPLTLIPHEGTWSWGTYRRVKQALAQSRPQIVQTWLFTADLYGRLAARRAGVPHIVSTVRSVEPDKPLHYVWADRFLKRWTDRFIVNARAVGDVLRSREGVGSQKISVIYNGLDPALFSPCGANGSFRREIQVQADVPLIGIVGRLAPVKDHETFLQAASLVLRNAPEALFLIVGDGDRKERLEKLAVDLGIQKSVRFFQSRQELAGLYGALDLLAVSSVYEGCSNVILEAMAAGKPVVATAVGGNPELVVPEETGLLVPPKKPQKLAAAIQRLIADPALRRRMGERARRRVEEEFTLQRMVQQTLLVYEELHL
ncbi:MAG: glycosyltransferase [Candidatus Omnitrophica bacterium]|nr:glycosyltransferase [Candidatus Omnitrophota bacterium]